MDPDLDLIRVPKLIIQPLVENAVTHATESMCEECRIEIFVQKINNQLEIRVQNTGSQFEDQLLEKLSSGKIVPRGFGIGLPNIDKRIRLMFGSDCGLLLYNADGMATACIRLPLDNTGT
ncbi:MAG: ATP-binding protein [Eubacteriales bacterium]|nr:ATP-binding protein [Eubacteriales bacterium]